MPNLPNLLLFYKHCKKSLKENAFYPQISNLKTNGEMNVDLNICTILPPLIFFSNVNIVQKYTDIDKTLTLKLRSCEIYLLQHMYLYKNKFITLLDIWKKSLY